VCHHLHASSGRGPSTGHLTMAAQSGQCPYSRNTVRCVHAGPRNGDAQHALFSPPPRRMCMRADRAVCPSARAARPTTPVFVCGELAFSMYAPHLAHQVHRGSARPLKRRPRPSWHRPHAAVATRLAAPRARTCVPIRVRGTAPTWHAQLGNALPRSSPPPVRSAELANDTKRRTFVGLSDTRGTLLRQLRSAAIAPAHACAKAFWPK